MLWFERDWSLFIEPVRWPLDVISMSPTHDPATAPLASAKTFKDCLIADPMAHIAALRRAG